MGGLRRLAVVLLAGLLAGAAASAAIAGVVSSQPLSGHVPGTASKRSIWAGARYRIVVQPGLQAAGAGWESFLTYSRRGLLLGGGGGGGGYPTKSWPFFGGGFSPYAGRGLTGEAVDYVLTGPEVAAVRVGRRTIATFTDPGLPAGDRVAVFFVRRASPAVILPVPGGPRPGNGLRVVPLDSSGHVIPTRLTSAGPSSRTRFWQAPSAAGPGNRQPPYHGPAHPLPGACELGSHGLAGLTPEFGHVTNRVVPVSNAEGEVFLACIDTEYYLRGWPLEVSVLLDAAHPGQVLGPIPGSVPVAGDADTVNVPLEQFPGALTARRVGTAWLVVQGGSGIKQRLRVLRALEIRKLALPG